MIQTIIPPIFSTIWWIFQFGIESGIYGNDIRNKAASYASAGSDARMSGCGLPVMTTSGSGNQGMTASLPIIKFAAEKKLSEEELIRGLFVSHLTTIHVKTNVGRLSAYCGAICAAAGVAAATIFQYIPYIPAIRNTGYKHRFIVNFKDENIKR